MGKTAVAIDLTQSERRELESLASRRKTAQGLAQWARIVLHAAEGAENKDISLRVDAVGGGLYDEPRPDAPRRSATTPPRSFARPLRRRRGTQRAGACVRWRRPPGLPESTIHRI